MNALPSLPRTFWLFVRLRLRRLSNTMGSRSMFKRRAPGRQGTGRKAATSPALMGFIGTIMTLAFFNIHARVLHAISQAYPFPANERSPEFIMSLGAFFVLTNVAALLMTLGNREIAKAEWDLEWLITLPLSKGRLMALRIAERTAVNPVTFLAVYPMMTLLLIEQGMVWYAAAVAGYVVSLPVLLLLAVAQTIVDTGLRVHMKPSQIRNLQGVFNIAGVVAFYLVLATQEGIPPAVEWIRASLGSALLYLPAGLSVAAIASPHVYSYVLWLVEVALLTWAGYGMLNRMLAAGVVAGSGQMSGPRPAKPVAAAALAEAGREAVGPASPRHWITPMIRKELKLLARDRNYLVQTVLMPILIIGMQIYLGHNTNLQSGSVNAIAVTAFGMIVYALMFSVMNLLNSEGMALWILYTFPRSIKSMMMEKAWAWLGISVLYWSGFLAFAVATQGFSLELSYKMGLALLGVPIFVILAMALGVFSFDPHTEVAERRLKVSIVYLYMLVAATYGAGFFYASYWSTFVGIVLISLVAYAFWQKAAEQLPYLLDPTEAPPPRVSLSDGMIAVYGFFVLQVLFGLLFHRSDNVVLYAFSLAGFVTCALAWFHFQRVGARDLPVFRAKDPVRAILFGTLAGLVCAVFGQAYIEIIEGMGWFPEISQQTMQLKRGELQVLAVMAVFAAPVFEEYIFRGLVFNGLSKTVRPTFAVLASAALFAVVHPPVGAAPVFVLGLATALLYRWQQSLMICVAAHAAYNTVAILVPWLVSR